MDSSFKIGVVILMIFQVACIAAGLFILSRISRPASLLYRCRQRFGHAAAVIVPLVALALFSFGVTISFFKFYPQASPSIDSAAVAFRQVSLTPLAVVYALAFVFAGLLMKRAISRRASVNVFIVGFVGLLACVCFLAAYTPVGIGSLSLTWPISLPGSIIASVILFSLPIILTGAFQVIGRWLGMIGL